MTRQRENRLTGKIRQALQLKWPDIFVFKVWGSDHMMAGLPDLIGCWRGRFFGLEVKLPESRNQATPRQLYIGDRIQAAQGVWAIVCSPTEAIEALERSVLADDA